MLMDRDFMIVDVFLLSAFGSNLVLQQHECAEARQA